METDNRWGYIRIYKKTERYRSGNPCDSGRLHKLFAYQCHCADRPRINPHLAIWIKTCNRQIVSNPTVWIQTSPLNHLLASIEHHFRHLP